MSARISAPSPRCSPDVWGPRLSGGPHSVAHSQKGRRRSTTYKRVLECPAGRSSDRRSSSYGQWPFVTLEIDPERIAYDETVGGIAVRLVNIGGKFCRLGARFESPARVRSVHVLRSGRA